LFFYLNNSFILLESISLHYVSPPSLAMPQDIIDCVAAAGIPQVFILVLKSKQRISIYFHLEITYNSGKYLTRY